MGRGADLLRSVPVTEGNDIMLLLGAEFIPIVLLVLGKQFSPKCHTPFTGRLVNYVYIIQWPRQNMCYFGCYLLRFNSKSILVR